MREVLDLMRTVYFNLWGIRELLKSKSDDLDIAWAISGLRLSIINLNGAILRLEKEEEEPCEKS